MYDNCIIRNHRYTKNSNNNLSNLWKSVHQQVFKWVLHSDST